LLVCDGCNTTLHLPCVQLELQAKPAGRWFCCRSDSCTIKAKAHEWQSKATRQRQYKAPIAQYLGEIRATKPKGVYPLQWLQRECTSRNLSAGGHIRDLCDRLAHWELKFKIMYDDGDVEELDTSEALKLQVDSKHGHNGTKHATSSTCVMKPENVMQIVKSHKAYTRMDSRDSAIARNFLQQYLSAEADLNGKISNRILVEKEQALVKLVNDELVRFGRQPIYNLKRLRNWSKNMAYKELIKARGTFPKSWTRKTPVGMSVSSV
jgi:hypothetical protein